MEVLKDKSQLPGSNEIARYSETADATFPTPILLALPEGSYEIEEGYININDDKHVASIIDGQHRMLGLEKSNRLDEYTLPVVFVLDAIDEQKALIFAIINGNKLVYLLQSSMTYSML